VGASVAGDAVEAAVDADDDSVEDAEDATLRARSRGLVGMDLLDQVSPELDGLGGGRPSVKPTVADQASCGSPKSVGVRALSVAVSTSGIRAGMRVDACTRSLERDGGSERLPATTTPRSVIRPIER